MNPNPRGRLIELSLYANYQAMRHGLFVAVLGSVSIAAAFSAFSLTVLIQLGPFDWFRFGTAIFNLVVCWLNLRQFYKYSRRQKHWRSAASNMAGMATSYTVNGVEHFGEQVDAALSAAQK